MSRVALIFFLVFYTAYEVTVGLGTGILAEYANGLPASEQAVVADAIQHYNEDNILGDPISVSLALGLLGWMVAMIAAAVAFRRSGAGWPLTLLVGLTALFAIHPPPIGPAALVCFAAAAVLIERRWALLARPEPARHRTTRQPPSERSCDEDPDHPERARRAVGRSAGRRLRPTQPRRSTNLAGRMGRWSAQHRKKAIFGWLAFVVVAFAAGIVSGTTKIEQATSGVGESGRIDKLLHEEFVQPAGESVLVQSESLTVKDPAFAAAVEDVVARVSKLEAVTAVQSPLDPENAGQIGQAGHAALIDFEIRGDPDDATTKIDPVVAAVDDAQAAHPELFIGSFGVSASKEVEGAFLDDLKKAGLLSIPVTLIILIVVFGALVAAGIPLLLALTADHRDVRAGRVSRPRCIPIDEVTYELILLIGLAVGVDYSMFYLKREREERAAGRSEEAALEAAAATSGRSVLISGLTVIVAMSGMFLAGIQGMSAFALGTILVVAVAMLGSLTVLPATLSWLGDRVERGRIPFVRRLRRDDGEGRIWGTIVAAVLRRPVLSAVLSAGSAAGARRAGAAAAHGAARHRDVPAVPAVDPDVQPHPGGIPGERDPGRRRREGRRRHRAAGAGGDRPARVAGALQRADARADHGRRQRGRDDRDRRHPRRRQGDGRGLGGGARDPQGGHRPGDRRRAPGRRGRSHRGDCPVEGLQRQAGVRRSPGVRIRAPARLRRSCWSPSARS